MSRQSIRRRWLRIAFGLAAIGVLSGLSFILWSKFQENVRQTAVMMKMEDKGGKAYVAGYGGSGPLAKIPILSLLDTRTQLEVFVPNTQVAESSLTLLRESPDVKRIWVDLNDVDPAMIERIRKERPDVQIQRYTPSPQLRAQFKPPRE